jgi:hypothetical protein
MQKARKRLNGYTCTNLIVLESPVDSVCSAPLRNRFLSNCGAKLVYTQVRCYAIAGDRHIWVEQLYVTHRVSDDFTALGHSNALTSIAANTAMYNTNICQVLIGSSVSTSAIDAYEKENECKYTLCMYMTVSYAPRGQEPPKRRKEDITNEYQRNIIIQCSGTLASDATASLPSKRSSRFGTSSCELIASK